MPLSSKERVRRAFAHQEGDRVPIAEIEINSRQASQVLGRPAFTGVGGEFYAKWKAEMLIQGRREEYVTRYAQDLVELYDRLELDLFRVWPGPGRFECIPEQIAPNRWRYMDREFGIWEDVVYTEQYNVSAEVDSSIAAGGMEAFRRYVEAIERSDYDGIGMAVRQYAVSHPIDPSDFDALRHILGDSRGKKIFVLGTARIPYPSECSWLPLYLEAMVSEPDLVDRFNQQMAQRWLHYLRVQAEMGVDGIIDGVDFAGKHGLMVSPRMYRRFIQPYLKMYADECHKYGIPFVKHEDGNLDLIEKEFILSTGIDGYHAIEPVAGMDIGKLKRLYGDRITLLGNVDCSQVLVTGTREQIRHATRDVIRVASPGGGHVLSSSNSIHDGVPLENFMTMIEAGKEYGSYPIEL